MDAAGPGGIFAAELQLFHSACSHGAGAGHPPALPGSCDKQHKTCICRRSSGRTRQKLLRSKRWDLTPSVIADSCGEAFAFLLEFSGIAGLCP